MKSTLSLPYESRSAERTASKSARNSNQIVLATFAVFVLGASTLLAGLSLEVLEHTASTLNVLMQDRAE